MARFDEIDVDKSNSLEPKELAPVVKEIVGGLLAEIYGGEATMSQEQCLEFVMMVFDQDVSVRAHA